MAIAFKQNPERSHPLIRQNYTVLLQAQDLIERTSDADFTRQVKGSSSVGAQVRHVLEFYECFLDGLDTLHIDYDARKRNLAIESSRSAALAMLRAIIRRLDRQSDGSFDTLIWVRAEGGLDNEQRDWLTSSTERELQVLASHAVHHLALVAMMLRLSGVEPGQNVGVAASTLRYRKAGSAPFPLEAA